MENYIIANKTDVGSVRQVNEDSMITFDSPNGRIVAVCDGMGGQAAGDVASKLACDIIRDILENNTFANPLEAITCSVMAANQGILHKASQNPELQGMGATCVMLVIKDGKVYYGWVGDSRIYYISNHLIRQISKDQSYVQTLVDSGQITAEEAEHHPQKNEITNALGVEGMTPPVLCQVPIMPEPGSIFLLCSDGLTGMVDNKHIEHVVSRSDISLHEKAEALVQMANMNGGLDNITVQLVEFPHGGAMVSTNKVKSTKSNMLKVILISFVAFLLVFGGVFGTYMYLKKEEPKNAVVPAPPVKIEKKKVQKIIRQDETVPKTTSKTVKEINTKPTVEQKKSKDTKSNKTKGDAQSNIVGGKNGLTVVKDNATTSGKAMLQDKTKKGEEQHKINDNSKEEEF